MPDFGGPPVAAQINTNGPAQSIQTLSGLLNTQNQVQQLAVGQAQAQQAQQEMSERQLLQQAMASGQTPDGTSLKDSNGKIDPVAMSKFANTSLPLTGQKVQQSIIQTQQNKLQLNDAVRQLGQNYRNDMSGIVRGSIGNNDTGQQISSNIDNYVKLNPDAAAAAQPAQELLKNLNPAMPQAMRDSALEHLSKQFQPASTTDQEQRPAFASTTTPEGKMGLAQVNPASAVPVGQYGEVPQGIPLDQRTTQGPSNPLTGAPTFFTRDGQGNLKNVFNAPIQGGYNPLPGEKEQIPALNEQYISAQKEYMNAPNEHENNRIVLTNLPNVKATGPLGQPIRNIFAAFGIPFTGADNSATAYDLVGKGIARSMVQDMQSMGISTNDALNFVGKANGGADYSTPDALDKITRLKDGITSGKQAYFTGLQKATNASPKGILAKRDFDEQWGANFDPRIFEIYQAQKAGNNKLVQSYINGMGGSKSQEFKDLMQKANNLHQLSNTGSLQQ